MDSSSFFLIVFGSSVTVDSATKIANILGLSERFIGLTIVALGTSLPELFTSIFAAVLLLLCAIKGRKLRRWSGVLMLLCYAAYFAVIW